MTPSKNLIPLWILLLTGAISLLGIIVGISLYLSPGSSLPDVDFTANGVTLLTDMWAARQIAIASIMGYGVIRRRAAIMQAGLAIYCVMNIQDAAIGFLHQDMGLGIGATFFMALTGFLAFRLR